MASTQEHQFPTMQECAMAAAAAANAKDGNAYPGIFYRQGGRRMVSATLPCRRIVQVVSKGEVVSPKKIHTIDPQTRRNRPLVPEHVKSIKDYLDRVEQYILPPVLLNAVEPLEIFVYTSTENSPFTPCYFVLPANYTLHVTDGQHRIEALRQAIAEDTTDRFRRDAIAVSIIEESSLEKTHQDFYDAAQVKPLPPALLVEYDAREPINGITRDLVREIPMWTDRTLRIGRSVAKKSPMMFTNNNIRRFVIMTVTGDDSKEESAAFALARREMWRNRILAVLRIFIEENPQWKYVAARPKDAGEATNMEGFREKYLHFLAAGLMVIGGVAHTILSQCSSQQEHLSPAQVDLVTRLARDVDWSRENDMWRRSIVSVNDQGKTVVTASRAFLSTAVADVKRQIGLNLSDEDKRALLKTKDR